MARKGKYEKKSFESTGSGSDTSANIFESMLLSKAWQDLTSSQKVLYLTCKAQYYAQKTKPVPPGLTDYDTRNKGNSPFFYFNQALWLKEKQPDNPNAKRYNLYTNKQQFYRDMAELLNKGFLQCRYQGKKHRKKNEYEFIDKWQKYPNIEINQRYTTEAMKKQPKKSQTET